MNKHFTNPKLQVVGTLDSSGALVPTSIIDAYSFTATGYIYDNLCLFMPDGIAVDGTNVSYGVPQHTVDCLLIDACVNSGFVLRNKDPDGSYSTSYQISNSSIPQVVSYLKQLLTVRPDNVYTTISGSLDSTGAIVVSGIRDAAQFTVTGFLYDNLCES